MLPLFPNRSFPGNIYHLFSIVLFTFYYHNSNCIYFITRFFFHRLLNFYFYDWLLYTSNTCSLRVNVWSEWSSPMAVVKNESTIESVVCRNFVYQLYKCQLMKMIFRKSQIPRDTYIAWMYLYGLYFINPGALVDF